MFISLTHSRIGMTVLFHKVLKATDLKKQNKTVIGLHSQGDLMVQDGLSTYFPLACPQSLLFLNALLTSKSDSLYLSKYFLETCCAL